MASQELNQALWNAANVMRSTMSADEYKDYLLGMIFYKYLSDRQLYAVVDLLEDRQPESLDEAQQMYEEARQSEDWEDLKAELEENYSFAIEPQYTFTALYNEINNKTFTTDHLRQAMRDIEQGGEAIRGQKLYEGLFEDFDIDSKSLGTTPAKRNAMLSDVMKELAHIDFTQYGADALGDAYEYLIGQFAAGSGKKAGEFYTPQAVSELITRIVTKGKEGEPAFSIYDPCMGSGSLLLHARSYINEDCRNGIQFFGQEISHTTYNLARMNMILHNVPFQYQHFRNGDTLGADWPTEEPTNYDATVMNPPYSQHWSAAAGFLTDPRFQRYEKLAPKSKADFAFLLHGFYHLKENGTMGIVLPHGVLFRGAAEGTIRKHLLEDGNIYAVIGLPAGIFFNTSIPTCIIVLKKDHVNRDVLFIDASKEFRKEKAQNFMDTEHIDKIMAAYDERKDVDKFAHLATFEEIKENDYNLNIPRYVDTSEPEPEVDLKEVCANLQGIDAEIKAANNELLAMLDDLTSDDAEAKAALAELGKIIQGV
ncbi:putative type I restriction-modification system M subunit [Selenomonas ruminantium subsp. lactilytica TAM6421]|uniref:site-specific DNA-methyltransferase (adenine-specific) n=1 Tax=Selenomonas ruminantium subsp. lactilytica (strain NBRC 103574 / TAM6421) TaxID=927704 RepID=I0GPW0_SELRL|nr:type I restriction-modification system subunit M [Selenomonas ruminantium]BAL82797.1 putative type I restriction-modification system M subunit [Selenomonas ruminantium subsp. lactilytica TAM6421]